MFLKYPFNNFLLSLQNLLAIFSYLRFPRISQFFLNNILYCLFYVYVMFFIFLKRIADITNNYD